MRNEVLLLQFPGGIVVTLEEDQDGHVVQGVGGGVEVVCEWKVLPFVANRVQVLYKAVSDPPVGLTDVDEATSADGQVNICLMWKVFFGSLDG
eukprot:g16129.t1